MKERFLTWARILAPFVSGALGVLISVIVQQRVMSAEIASMKENMVRLDERGSTFARIHDAQDDRRVTELQRQIDDLKEMRLELKGLRDDLAEVKASQQTTLALLKQHQEEARDTRR